MKLTREDLAMMLDEVNNNHADGIDILVWCKNKDSYFHIDFAIENMHSKSKYDKYKKLIGETCPKF